MAAHPDTRRIVVLAYDGVEPLDVVGPADIFASAGYRHDGDAIDPPPYEILVAAPKAGPVSSFFGLRLVADQPLRALDPANVDTLIVAGGPGIRTLMRDRSVVDWIADAHGKVRRLCSVCSGAFLLAEAGLLDGRRAVTHWRWCDVLAADFPAVRLEPDAIWLRDGDIYTSAGVTAGMDLALALVEEDLGHRIAMSVARAKVMFMKRPGGQSQFSEQLKVQAAAAPRIADLQQWILRHPNRDLSNETLAVRMGMSPRHFARVFHEEAGMTPARFVAQARVAEARRRLEQGRDGIDRIAADSGFGNGEHMRRTFLRQLGVSPDAYRQRFRVGRRHRRKRPEAETMEVRP
jgi:transcriptional regulator GlxA family with amidase domain